MSILKICNDIKAAVRKHAYNGDSAEVRVGDIYDVNNALSVKYPMVVISQGKHSFDNKGDYLYYNLTLFYVDNMLDMPDIDLSATAPDVTSSASCAVTSSASCAVRNYLEDSVLAIQTAGTKCLLSTIYSLEDKYVIDGSLQVVPFKEKFNDVCAGVYVEIRIREDVTHCDVIGGR